MNRSTTRSIVHTLLPGLVAALILATTACSSGGGGDSGGGAKTVGIAMYSLDDPLFLGIRNGGEAAAADYGVNVDFQSANASLSSQISIVQNFILQGVDVIIIDPIDAKGILPVIQKAEAANIPVITMGNKVQSDYAHAMIYGDYNNMQEVAKIMATSIGETGQIALLVGAPGNYVSDTRQAGFVDTIKNYPDIDLVAVEPTGYDPAEAQSATETLLQKYPNLKGIAAITDPLALGSIAAARAANREGLVWTGYNGDPQMEPYLQDGTTLVDVLTGSTRIGYWFMAAAARIAKGEELDNTMYIKTYLASSEDTIADLMKAGHQGDLITVSEEATIRESYAKSFGPQAPTSALNAGDK